MSGHATVVVKVETVFKVTRSSRGSHVLNIRGTQYVLELRGIRYVTTLGIIRILYLQDGFSARFFRTKPPAKPPSCFTINIWLPFPFEMEIWVICHIGNQFDVESGNSYCVKMEDGLLCFFETCLPFIPFRDMI